MSASLTIIAGPDIGRSCPLSPGSTLVVGRGTNCGLQLSDPCVSRVHCRLIVDAEGVRLEDVDSRFGTLVNQRLVRVKMLHAGDTIGIGETEILVQMAEGRPLEPAVPMRRDLRH
jgi:pSer/pThr/pTyr-binding forkhead associated (FHA) protein